MATACWSTFDDTLRVSTSVSATVQLPDLFKKNGWLSFYIQISCYIIGYWHIWVLPTIISVVYYFLTNFQNIAASLRLCQCVQKTMVTAHTYSRCWANPRGYVGWWHNALRVPRLQEFDHMSPKSTQSMLWLTQSHSWAWALLMHYIIILCILSEFAQSCYFMFVKCIRKLKEETNQIFMYFFLRNWWVCK